LIQSDRPALARQTHAGLGDTFTPIESPIRMKRALDETSAAARAIQGGLQLARTGIVPQTIAENRSEATLITASERTTAKCLPEVDDATRTTRRRDLEDDSRAGCEALPPPSSMFSFFFFFKNVFFFFFFRGAAKRFEVRAGGPVSARLANQGAAGRAL
jgi:hypothetical protein